MLIRGVSIKIHGFILTISLFCPGSSGKVAYYCDTNNPEVEYDGRIGASETFPWVGLLKVYIQVDDGMKIVALAGLVLIHKEYAIAHAHDVARVPMEEFQRNAVLFFMVAPDQPWHFRAKKYYVHEEYQVLTVNTIALVQLDLTNEQDYPLKPICWNKRALNTTTNLYVIGIIRENVDYEKLIYKTHMIDKGKCRKKYETDGLNENKREPAHYLCGISRRFNHSCTWNNGMVAVTNTTQYFNLVGLSVLGPGCAAPARFIELAPYYDWVSEFIVVNTPVTPKSPNVPVHEMFVNDSALRNARRGFGPLDTSYYDLHDKNLLGQTITITSKAASKLIVYTFQGELELLNQSCSGTKEIMYSDWVEIQGPENELKGSMTFKLTYYDIKSRPYGCFKVKDSQGNTNITLHYMEILELTEKDAEFETTPEEYYETYMHQPFYNKTDKVKLPYFAPKFLQEDETGRRRVKNYDIFFTIPFKDKCKMVLEIYNDKNSTSRRMNVDVDKFQPQAEENYNINESIELLSNIKAHKNKSQKIFSTYNYPQRPLEKIFTRTIKRPVKLFPQTPAQYKKYFFITRAPKNKSKAIYASEVLDYLNKTVSPTRVPEFSPFVSFFYNAAPSIYLKTTYQLIIIAMLKHL